MSWIIFIAAFALAAAASPLSQWLDRRWSSK